MQFVSRSSSYTKQQIGVRSEVAHVCLALNKQIIQRIATLPTLLKGVKI